MVHTWVPVSGSGIGNGNGAGEARPSEATWGQGGREGVPFSFFSFWGREGSVAGPGVWGPEALQGRAGLHLGTGRARLQHFCSSVTLEGERACSLQFCLLGATGTYLEAV